MPLDRLPGRSGVSIATTPNYSLITPNLCDDGHDSPCVDGRPGGLGGVDASCATWVPRILASPAYRDGGLLAIMFDESDGSDASACCGETPFPNTPNNGGLNLGPRRRTGRRGAALAVHRPGHDRPSSAYNHFSPAAQRSRTCSVWGTSATPAAAGLQASRRGCVHLLRAEARGPARAPAGGSEIKLAVIGQGTAPRPMVELKLWHGGRVSVTAARTARRPLRTVGRARTVSACQLLKIRLPYAHGRVVLTARAYRGAERRTLSF